MSTARRLTAVLLVAVLGLTLIGAEPAPDEQGDGRIDTRLQLLSLGLTDLPLVGDLDGALGALTTRAGTVDGPAAALLLEGLRAGDATAADWAASSAEGPSSGSTDLPLGDLGVPGVTGGLSLVDYLVEADADSAAARLSALTGQLGAGPLGMAISLGERGVDSTVTPTDARGITELAVDGLSLQVGDLLPGDLLDALPLGVVLDLLDELPVDLDADLADAIDQLEQLLAELDAVVDLDEQRRDVFDQLRDLLSDHPDVVDAEQVLADAEALLADAQQTVDDLRDDLDDALADLVAEESALADALADLDDLEALVDDLQDEVADLEDELADLQADLAKATSLTSTTSLTTLVDGLTDLAALYPEADCGSIDVLLGLLALQDVAECFESHLSGLVSAVESSLASVEADLAAAVDDRDDQQALVDTLQTSVGDLEDLVSDLQTDLAGAEAVLSDAQDAVADAIADLEDTLKDVATGDALALLDLFDDLTQQLLDLLDEVTGLLEDLPDLVGLRDALAGSIAGTPLFDLGRLALGVEVHADAEGADATVTCEVADLSVFGQTPLPAVDCNQLDAALGEVEGVLSGLLGALPIELPVIVDIGGLQVSTDTFEDPEEGVSEAVASVSALRARVGSVELTDVVDQLTAQLESLVGDVLDVVDGLGDLDTGGLPVIGEIQAVGASPAALTDDLDRLVDGLPVGDALDGLRTVGLDLAVAGLDAEGLFAATATDEDPDPDTDPGTDPDGGAPDGGDPQPAPGGEDPAPAPDGEDPDGAPGGTPGGDTDPAPGDGDPTSSAPDLPNTGGGVALLGTALLALALWLRRS